MTEQEVVEFVEENDVKFIRLAFVDIFGTMKNISIMPTELGRAFAGGVSFDASAVKGFCDESNSELFLQPDPNTLTVLPWRPQTGRVARMMCDCYTPEGELFDGHSRTILRRQVEKARKLGYIFRMGTEYEFYLFNADEQGIRAAVIRVLSNHGYVTEKDEGKSMTFRKASALSKAAKIWEDRISVEIVAAGAEIEGLTKDVVRLVSALEAIPTQEDE